MLVKLTNKQFPSSVCCYMCVLTCIQYGLIYQADFERRSGSSAWEMDRHWLLTVLFRKEYWKRDEEKRQNTL